MCCRGRLATFVDASLCHSHDYIVAIIIVTRPIDIVSAAAAAACSTGTVATSELPGPHSGNSYNVLVN